MEIFVRIESQYVPFVKMRAQCLLLFMPYFTVLAHKVIFIKELQACDSAPCLNNGSCIEVNDVNFVCACRDGFYGVTCEQSEYFFLLHLN